MKSSMTLEEAAVLTELARGGIVLEFGAEYGRSTIAMAQTAKIVHSVDWHGGDLHSTLKDSLPEFIHFTQAAGVAERIFLHVGRFEDFAPLVVPNYFTMVFLDGFHTYEAVARDIQILTPAMDTAQHLAFHDYERPNLPGVKQAVDEYLSSRHLTPKIFQSLAYVSK